jgi:hypothetical protein
VFTRVFGFPQQENMDERDFYPENTTRVLHVSQQGDVIFAVGGYMNRGPHEGGNGIGVYRYDAGSALVRELCFLESMENTERIQMDLLDCLYLTQDAGSVWTMLDGVLYQVAISDGEVKICAEGIHNDCYRGSKSGRYFAWLKEGLMYASSTLEEIDFETGQIREIQGGENEFLRPLTYMKEDLVYGTARVNDVSVPHGGRGIFPMYRLTFEDGSGNVAGLVERGEPVLPANRICDVREHRLRQHAGLERHVGLLLIIASVGPVESRYSGRHLARLVQRSDAGFEADRVGDVGEDGCRDGSNCHD